MNAPRTAIAATALLWLACTDPTPTGPAEEAASEPDRASGAPAPALQVGTHANGEEIHACVNKGSGALYQPNGKKNGCKKEDEEISWNREGPPGPQGEPGISGYERVDQLIRRFGDSGSAVAECPEGKRVLGGGYFVNGLPENASRLRITRSAPFRDFRGGLRVGWVISYFKEAGAGTLHGNVYAICASVAG